MPKISIIIPVYNTSEYLSRCLDSICTQTFHDIEIICVNDCSIDNSLSILYSFYNHDSRIKIINFEKNCGPGAARNAGLLASKGEYIGFVDSDDKISPNFCEKLYSKAISTQSDIVCGGMEQYRLNGKIITDKEKKEYIKKNKAFFCSGFTTAIYNTNMLHKFKIKFKEGIPRAEDAAFLLKSVSVCNHIAVVNDTIYYYLRRNDGQDTKKLSFEKIFSVHHVIDEILQFINENSVPEHIANIQILYLLNTIFNDITRSESKDFIHTVHLGVEKVIEIFKNRPNLIETIYKHASVYPLLSNPDIIIYLKQKNIDKLISSFIRIKLSHGTIKNNIKQSMKHNQNTINFSNQLSAPHVLTAVRAKQ